MDRSQRDGVLLLLVAAIGYSFMPVIAKTAYAGGLEPLDLLTWRFLLATPIIWLVVLARRSPPARTRLPRLPLLGMGVIFALVALLAFLTLERVPASIYTVLLYSYPAFVALLSLLLGERLHLRGWIALGLTLVGIALTVPNVVTDLGSADPLGIIFGLLNAVVYSVYIVVSGRLLQGNPNMPLATAFGLTGSCLAILLVALPTGLRLPPNPAAWASIAALVGFSTVIPVFAFYSGLQKLGAARAAILSTLEPVMTLLWSFALLGETMQPVQWLGAALILSGAVQLQLRRSPQPALAPARVTPAVSD